MIKEVARAKAATLKEWADDCEREALSSGPGSGYGEVAFLLRRAAAALGKATGDDDAVQIEGDGATGPRSGGEPGSGSEDGILASGGSEVREG